MMRPNHLIEVIAESTSECFTYNDGWNPYQSILIDVIFTAGSSCTACVSGHACQRVLQHRRHHPFGQCPISHIVVTSALMNGISHICCHVSYTCYINTVITYHKLHITMTQTCHISTAVTYQTHAMSWLLPHITHMPHHHDAHMPHRQCCYVSHILFHTLPITTAHTCHDLFASTHHSHGTHCSHISHTAVTWHMTPHITHMPLQHCCNLNSHAGILVCHCRSHCVLRLAYIQLRCTVSNLDGRDLCALFITIDSHTRT